MSDELEAIYLEALEIKSPEERAAYLDRACMNRPEIRVELSKMFADADAAEAYFPPEPRFEDSGAMTAVIPQPSSSTNHASELAGLAGQQIGNYRLLEPLGEGGFGTVWLAEQFEPVKRRVALKIIKPGMDTREVIARFEAERQALAMMDHPNIARVLDAGATENGRPFFVMEWVDGLPVTAFCQEHKLNTKRRLELFVEICSAVNHAHQKGIIHRDLKPSNVLVSDLGDHPVPKVIDFGIAKATEGKLTDKTVCTQLGQFIGTPAYMSPEQAGVEPMASSDIDTRSDIYSLGVLLYELLTGNPPFESRSLLVAGYEEMRRIIREVEPPRPSLRISSLAVEERKILGDSHQTEVSKLSRFVHGDLDWIVMKAMEKDRARRYQAVLDLTADIRRFLAHEPVSATPPSLRYQAGKFVRRHKAKLAVAAALMMALLAGTAVSTWQAIRATRGTARAVAAEALAADRLSKAENLSSKIREQLIQSHTASGVDRLRDGELSLALPWLVRALTLNQADAGEPTASRVRIAQVLRHVPELRRFWSKTGPASFVKFSADAEYALAIGATDGVKGRADGGFGIWSVGSGLPVELEGVRKEDVLWAAFSPREARLAVIDRTRQIKLWDLQRGGLPLEFEISHPQGHHVLFSPDGTKLLSYGYSRLAKLWDAATGRVLIPKFDIQAGSNLRSADFSPDGRHVSILNYNGYTHTLDVETGKPIFRAVVHRGDPVKVQYTPTGKLFATSGWSEGPATFVWNAVTGARTAVLKQHEKVSSFDISPDGAAIATVSFNPEGHLHLWNARTFERLAPPMAQGSPSSDVRFSPDSQFVVTTSWDQSARVWDAHTGQPAGPTLWHSAAVQGVDFHPSGRYILTGCVDGTVRIWSLAREPAPSLVLQPEGGADHMAMDPSGERVLIATARGTLQVWNTSDGTLHAPAIVVGNAVEQVEFVRDNRFAVAASRQPAVQLWDLHAGTVVGSTLKPSASWEGAPTAQPSCAVNPDGTRVVAVFSTETESRFQVGDPTAGRMIGDEGKGAPLRYFEMSPDGRVFAVARGSLEALGHELTFWSTETGESVGSSIDLEGFTAVGAFSPDGTTFALVTQTSPGHNLPDFSVLRAWNVEDGEEAGLSGSWTGDTAVMRYDPEGRRIVVSQGDRLRILEARSGKAVSPHMIHRHAIVDARFSPNGLYVGSIDGTEFLYLHDAASGQPLTMPISHPAPVIGLCFSPDSRHLITSCRDGRVRFWNLEPELSSSEDLTRFAQLVSGHEIDETGALSPLSTSDFEKQWQAWVGSQGGLRPVDGPADDPRSVPTLAALSSLAVSRMAEGRVTAALSYLAERSARNPGDTIAAMKLAALQVWFEADAAYAEHCRRMLEWARDTKDAAAAERVGKLICLRPIHDPVLQEQVLSLTHRALDVGRTDGALPWFQLAHGMAQYRGGHYEEADRMLESAKKAGASVYMADPLRRTAGLYLAMSQRRQGKIVESKKLFAEAGANLNPPPQNIQNILVEDIPVDDLILWLTLQETAAMLNAPVSQSP